MSIGPLTPVFLPQSLAITNNGPTVVPLAVRLPRNPLPTDRTYPVGSIWANTDLLQAFILTNVSGGQADWAPCGVSPLGDVRRLTGDTGGIVPPTSNNINIVGAVGSGITVAGDPATSTLSLVHASTFVEGTATTVDGVTFVDLLSIPVPVNKTLVFDGRLVGWTADGGGGGATSLIKMGAFRLAGPNAVQVGNEDVTLDKQGSLGPANSTTSTQVAASAGNIVLAVRGVVGVTVQWKVQGLFTTVGV